jgi:hypothetical protein
MGTTGLNPCLIFGASCIHIYNNSGCASGQRTEFTATQTTLHLFFGDPRSICRTAYHQTRCISALSTTSKAPKRSDSYCKPPPAAARCPWYWGTAPAKCSVASSGTRTALTGTSCHWEAPGATSIDSSSISEEQIAGNSNERAWPATV